MRNLFVLFAALGLLTISNQSLAHPKGTDSVLDQNIVSIDLNSDINIPPNFKQIELVRAGRSYCVMNMVEGVGFDRSLKAANLSVMSVELFSEKTSRDDFSTFEDHYVLFKISSKKNPRQEHPSIKNILCGYDITDNGVPRTLMVDGWATDSYRRFAIPTFDQLNSYSSKMMSFQLGDTVDISNQ